MNTVTSIQDKQIAGELAAIRKHGSSAVGRSVIYRHRTAAIKALIALGLNTLQAREAIKDAADMVVLALAAAAEVK